MRKYKPAERIYKAFYDSRESRLYFSQIQELSGLSGGSLVNAFRQLEATREVQATRNKAHTFYALRNRDIAALHFTRFDYEKLESLSNRVRVPVRKFVTELPQGICFALLFGSTARKQERLDSNTISFWCFTISVTRSFRRSMKARSR